MTPSGAIGLECGGVAGGRAAWQPGPVPRVPHSTDDLQEAEDALMRAFLEADAAALEALLDDEISVTGVDGEVSGKWDVVDAYRSGRRRVTTIEVERSRVRVMSELGLAVLTVRVEGAEAGAPFTSRERHTRTWRLAEGWTLVAFHASAARP
ncbi:MAG: nuclear transport factor 2 family protein [Solirubrobacteraceae bacterium]|nr:nuclear transport factor 2 family protein [Solirubrobacteraceae bacterium]